MMLPFAARPGSLRKQLMCWLLMPLLILMVIDAVSGYGDALEVADMAYDCSIAALRQPVYNDTIHGIALIQVGETMDARRSMARKILFDTMRRQSVLVALMALLVWLAVRRALRPLMQLRSDVESRAPNGFDPNRVHQEMRPLVLAMNSEMKRLHTLIAEQRRFIADASHQLRTALTVLKTQADLALRECDHPHDPRGLRELVENMAGATDSTVHLANRLLMLACAGHGVAEDGIMPVSLTEVARRVTLELAQQAVAGGIDMTFDAAGDMLIDGNPLLLHELAMNLLDNAIRYTPADGRVTVRVFRQDRCVVLEVEDGGPGIPAADRERVFAPFYRVPSAQLVNPHGTGLGMSIIRDIVSAHSGEIILADGANGQGLLVRVRFPVSVRT
ncbi:MAG: HAMP domain-containing sensor histidine kinase [Herbaspirillum sp.]